VDRTRPEYRTFVNLTCHRCHGPDLAGTHKGPALADLDRHWTRDGLVDFLREPSATQAPRLQALSERYAPPVMPAYAIMASVLVDLADFLLAPGP